MLPAVAAAVHQFRVIREYMRPLSVVVIVVGDGPFFPPMFFFLFNGNVRKLMKPLYESQSELIKSRREKKNHPTD